MEHRTIKVPVELLEKINKKIEKEKLGYGSSTEYIKEATREKLSKGGAS